MENPKEFKDGINIGIPAGQHKVILLGEGEVFTPQNNNLPVLDANGKPVQIRMAIVQTVGDNTQYRVVLGKFASAIGIGDADLLNKAVADKTEFPIKVERTKEFDPATGKFRNVMNITKV